MKNIKIINTNKFKTISILIDFNIKIENINKAALALLSYIYLSSNKKYKNMREIELALFKLGGAYYNSNLLPYGNTEHLQFYFQIPNPIYLEDEKLLDNFLGFIKEIIDNPLISEDTFDQEKERLLNDLQSFYSDPKKIANTYLKEFLFKSDYHKTPKYGSLQEIKQVTLNEVIETFHKIRYESKFSLMVNGDVEDLSDVFVEFATHFNNNIDINKNEIYYRQLSDKTPRKKEINHVGLNQAQLKLAFNLNKHNNLHKDDRFALILLNAILGGTPNSLLFQDVREKEGLVYSVHSKLHFDLGFIIVSAILDEDNIDKTVKITENNLDKLRNMNILNTDLLTAKKLVCNEYLSQQDSQFSVLNNECIKLMFENELSISEWQNKLNEVTLADIAKVANNMNLDTKFILKS